MVEIRRTGRTPLPSIEQLLAGIDADPLYISTKGRLDKTLKNRKDARDTDVLGAETEIGLKKTRLNQRRPELLNNVLENFAGRGMTYSGRYLQDRKRTDDDIDTELNDYDTELAGRKSAIQRALDDYQTQYDNELDEAKSGYAQRMAVKAQADAEAQAAAEAAATKVGPSQIFLPEGSTDITSSLVNPLTGVNSGAPAIQTADGTQGYVSNQPPKGAWMNPGTMNDGRFTPVSQPVSPAEQAANNAVNTATSTAGASYTVPLIGDVPAAPAPRQMTQQLTRDFSNNKAALDILNRGGVVTSGTGYKYKLINGVATRIA